MNKKNLLFSFALTITAFAANSQTNLGFETWQKTGIYDMPDGWTSSNILAALAGDSASIIKSTNAFNSAFSLKLTPFKSKLSAGDIVPGFVIQTAKYNKRPKTVRFQYHQKAKDSAYITIYLYNKNLQSDTNLVGYVEYDLAPNSNWAQKAIDFTYDNNKSVDSVEITILSGGNLKEYTLIDNISFSSFTSDIIANGHEKLQVYPNPTTGFLTIENPTTSATTLKMINLTGQTVFTKDLGQGNQILDITSVKPGIYFYNLTFEDSSVPQTGKLIVQ